MWATAVGRPRGTIWEQRDALQPEQIFTGLVIWEQRCLNFQKGLFYSSFNFSQYLCLEMYRGNYIFNNVIDSFFFKITPTLKRKDYVSWKVVYNHRICNLNNSNASQNISFTIYFSNDLLESSI